MPNTIGNDKQSQESRRAEETQEFNLRFMAYELELLSLLLEQTERRFDRPPESLTNAKEIADRMKQYVKEIIKD